MHLRFKKILTRIFIIFKAKKIFSAPQKTKVLIFDGSDKDLLVKITKIQNYDILYTRGEYINFYILMKTFFSKAILKNFFENYCFNYIKYSNPKLVITFIDNNPIFFKIKNNFPNIKTIVIQNGTGQEEFFDKILQKNFQIDHIFSFGKSLGKKYLKSNAHSFKAIGSIKNNECKIRKFKRKKNLFFISPFSRNLKFSETRFNNESFLVNCIFNYCKKNNINFGIIGRTQLYEERKYYNKMLNQNSYKFIELQKFPYNYKFIDKNKYYATIHSTLGLEALSRGSRVSFFNIFHYNKFKRKADILWPSKLKREGSFWTSKNKKMNIHNILNFITKSSHKEWKKAQKLFVPDLINYDFKNTIIRKEISKFLKN